MSYASTKRVRLFALCVLAAPVVFFGAGCSSVTPKGASTPTGDAATLTEVTNQSSSTSSTATSTQPRSDAKSAPPISATSTDQLVPPLSNAVSRVTKKFFGTYVTPKDSPISPERFTGYHTGIDFETTPNEQKSDVSVNAVCTGRLVAKKWAQGYGGVAVQQCTVAKQVVTVVYGHLRESSISQKAGSELKAGQPFAVLGTGFSTETDGERKHLHLGIHIGPAIDILGYVQQQSMLTRWIDPLPLLRASR
jgi:hypothetical protein